MIKTFTTSIFATSVLTIQLPLAPAIAGARCVPYDAKFDMANVLMGGGTLKEAHEFSIRQGNMDGTRECFLATLGAACARFPKLKC